MKRQMRANCVLVTMYMYVSGRWSKSQERGFTAESMSFQNALGFSATWAQSQHASRTSTPHFASRNRWGPA